MRNELPRLYAIADAGVLAARGISLEEFARGLRAAGVALVQYRDKTGSPQVVLRAAVELREIFAGSGATLILNDRADLAVLAEFDGVHVGQRDLSPEDARRAVSPAAGHPASGPSQQREGWGTRAAGGRMVGVSTHTEAQVRVADASCADYVAIGPVFTTGTKADTEPVVGLGGVRRARGLTARPLVAIGGITLANARSVIEAGADSVAVISGLLAEGQSVERVARDFLEVLR